MSTEGTSQYQTSDPGERINGTEPSLSPDIQQSQRQGQIRYPAKQDGSQDLGDTVSSRDRSHLASSNGSGELEGVSGAMTQNGKPWQNQL
jgi:hypothetical protein